MAGTHGTSLVRFKRAYLDLIDAQTTEKVTYQSPMQAKDMLGDAGSGIAAWFADDADANHGVTVFQGTPLWVDETVYPVLRIQALGVNTDDDQETVDERASQILYYAIGVLANDPSCGLVDDDIQEFDATPDSWTYTGGILPSGDLRAARFELRIKVEARLKLVLA